MEGIWFERRTFRQPPAFVPLDDCQRVTLSFELSSRQVTVAVDEGRWQSIGGQRQEAPKLILLFVEVRRTPWTGRRSKHPTAGFGQ